MEVGKSVNVINSHVGYKIKSHEDGSLSMKGIICRNGNRDKHKKKTCKYSTNAQFDVIRLLLFLSIMVVFRLGSTDVKVSFMKSGPSNPELYVRPQKDLILLFKELANKL